MTSSIAADARAAARIVLAGLVLLFAFTALYVTAFHAPRPRGVDIGFVGAPGAGRAGAGRLDAVAPGGFDVRRYADEPAARAALLDTDVRGVLVAGVPRDRSSWLRPWARRRRRPSPARSSRWPHTGAPAVVQDLRPLPGRRPPRALDALHGHRHPDPEPRLRRTALGLRPPAHQPACAGPRSPPTRCWPDWWPRSTSTSSSARSPGTSPGSRSSAGCSRWRSARRPWSRAPGRARGGRRRRRHADAAGREHGGRCGDLEFEPGFYGAVSQFLPPGAALTAVRNVQYFDWAATLAPLLVLGAWAAGGLALGLLGERSART